MSDSGTTENLAHTDSARVFETLDTIAQSPSLATAAKVRFVTDGGESTEPEVVTALTDAAFLAVNADLTQKISAFLSMNAISIEARDELPKVERQLKTTEVQLRHAAEKRDKGRLLKSKATQWEESSRHKELEESHRELLERRGELEETSESADRQLSAFVEWVEQNPELRHSHWVGQQVVTLNYAGRFLYDTLRDMNPNNFPGRSLAQIISIGQLLV